LPWQIILLTITGSRKKVNGGAFSYQNQKEGNGENATSGLAMIPTASWSLLDTLPATTQREFQSFSEGVDFGSMSFVDSSEEHFEISGGSFLNSWPRPPPILSPQNGDIPINGEKRYKSPDHRVDQAGHPAITPITFPSNASHVCIPTEGLPSPISMKSNKEISKNAQAGAEDAPLEVIPARSLVNSAASSYANQSNPSGLLHKCTHFSHSVSQTPVRTPTFSN
jgi:hypothetical protein